MQPLRQSTARTFPSHISTAASRIARIIVEPVDAPEALYNKDHGASQEYMTRIKKEKGLPMACPNCGQPTIEGAKFCASCGSPLIQTTAAAPQAPAAAESDDGTMLSSAHRPRRCRPLPSHCPIAPHRQLRKPPSRSPPHRNRRRKHSRPLRRRQRKRWHHRPRRRSSSSMRHPRPRSRQQRRSQASRPSKSPVRRPIPPSPR